LTSAEGGPRSENAPSEAGGVCPDCGAVVEPSQEYCLACGRRLVETGGANLAERWRHALPLTDRDWGWPILIALIIAILASVFAIVDVQQGKKTRTLKALGPTVRQTTITPTTATVQTITGNETTGTTSTGAKTTAHTGTTSTSPSSQIHSTGLIDWPGPSGYTIVLASLRISNGKAVARQKALEALRAGLGDVGVLASSDFSSLHPGYFVVFSGVYESLGEASKHLSAARQAGFDSPYPTRVAS
jgi:hypothetical protein